MVDAIGTALTAVVGWVGEVVTAVCGASGSLKDLLPLVAIGVAVTACSYGVKIIKSFVWGA